MSNEERIAELEAAIARWAKQVDELEAERDLLRQELYELRERYGTEIQGNDE